MITFQFIAIGSPTFLIDTGCVFFGHVTVTNVFRNCCLERYFLRGLPLLAVFWGSVGKCVIWGSVLGLPLLAVFAVFSATVGVFCDGKWCFLCGLRVGLVIMLQQQLLLLQQRRRRQFSATVSDVSLHGLKGCSC